MLFSAILAFAATAMAAPAVIESRQGITPLCSSGTPVCCATDILDLANLDCFNRTSHSQSTNSQDP